MEEILKEFLDAPNSAIDKNVKPLIQKVLDAEDSQDKAEKWLDLLDECAFSGLVSDFVMTILGITLNKYILENNVNNEKVYNMKRREEVRNEKS